MTGRIYISGPMTGKHLWNWPAFERAEAMLLSQGWDVVSPAKVDEDEGLVTVTRRPSYWATERRYLEVVAHVEVPETFDFREAIRRDLELLDGCTAIYLLRGWDLSLGANIELDRALRLGLEVLVEGGAEVPAFLPADTDPPDALLDQAWHATLEPGPHEDDVAFATDRDEGWGTEAEAKALTGEVRVVDPLTGGEKGSKLARFDLIPHEALTLLAEHFGRGAEKYEDRNWERGYDWALTFAALNRHLWAWWGGEDIDPETGSPHMAAVAWHAFVALTFQERNLGTDTRPTVSERGGRTEVSV